jgi:hypothetical protein
MWVLVSCARVARQRCKAAQRAPSQSNRRVPHRCTNPNSNLLGAVRARWLRRIALETSRPAMVLAEWRMAIPSLLARGTFTGGPAPKLA